MFLVNEFIFPELNQYVFKEKYSLCSFTEHPYSAAHIKERDGVSNLCCHLLLLHFMQPVNKGQKD